MSDSDSVLLRVVDKRANYSQIRSRRKRPAVDPCLGFYPVPTPQSNSNLRSEPPTPVITVESFLQRTKKRRRVLVNLDHQTAADSRTETAHKPRRRLRKTASSQPKPALQRKKATIQSFSKRLLEAALSCQVDPVDSLYEGSDVVPLKFDVIRTPEPSSLKRRSISFVDPRKARPFASVLCSFSPHASPNTKSLTKSRLPSAINHKESKESSRQVHQRAALEFVPLGVSSNRSGIKKTRPTIQTRMPLLPDSQLAQNDYTRNLQSLSPCCKEDSLETSVEPSSPYQILVPDSDSPGPTTRALKPLASYFDEFLQTIRTATQLAADQQTASICSKSRHNAP